MAAAFDLAGNQVLPATYPQIPPTTNVPAIPVSILKAVGWVESGWRQFSPRGYPLVSSDFGYGIMQITSGMAGAFRDVHGQFDDATQSRIASEYTYNIAEGAVALALKYAGAPKIGNADPQVVDHWYYALWAYNGWGWVNNPNNPRFTRQGSPVTNPAAFPYQERVLYLVAHPPRDTVGNPLWRAVPVTQPSKQSIGTRAGPLNELKPTHVQPPASLAAVEQSAPLRSSSPGQSQNVVLKVINTGVEAWVNSSSTAIEVGYHLFTAEGDPWGIVSPFAQGIVAYGQGIVPLPHNVLPGQVVVLSLTLQAPRTTGTFRVAWDLVQGDTAWFSESGSLPRAQLLHVFPSGQRPSPTPSPLPTSTPQADESLRYVGDTSIPDGTSLARRQSFDKGWLVFNDGKSPWQSGWRLRLRSGMGFGGKTITVPGTNACSSRNVVAHLRAPTKAGVYSSVWRLQDPSGRFVGDRLTLRVTVHGTSVVPTPTPTPRTARTPIAPTATATPVG